MRDSRLMIIEEDQITRQRKVDVDESALSVVSRRPVGARSEAGSEGYEKD